MAKRNNVHAYYADFYTNNYCYTIISKDNILKLSEGIESKNINQALVNIGQVDIIYISEGREDYYGVIVCGYIVKSELDETFHWLRPDY